MARQGNVLAGAIRYGTRKVRGSVSWITTIDKTKQHSVSHKSFGLGLRIGGQKQTMR